ncbi:MAG: response regulator transcription factor [Phaeodactylibacter sp.]|nr:response regulator transcription factor [Phaeodactylibacter sp.]MCB9274987.1 response regulator transcription factor [Lewinellaceae bacterium]
MEDNIKVILADDHQLVRQGIRALLEELGFIESVAEASDGRQVLQLLRNGLKAQVVLLDVEMPGMGGIETLEHLSRDFFGVRAIMLTMLNDRAVIQRAVDKGAKGYIFKNASLAELSDAISKVVAGGTYFASDVALALLQPSSDAGKLLSQLSEREVEILKLIAEGFSSAEIGKKLFISPRTVDTHRNNLIQKLQANGIAGLVRFAVLNKLV